MTNRTPIFSSARSGFMLIEAVASVAVVSICLVLIMQALMTNLKAGARFQQRATAIFAAENQLGIVYAAQGFADLLPATATALEEPYERIMFQARTKEVEDGLKNIVLTLNNAQGKPDLNVATIIFKPGQTEAGSITAP